MTHSLTLGSRLLTDSLPDDEHGFVFNVLAEGMGFGVAKGVQEVITSLLADGDLVRIDRYGNREVSFAVEITGPSLGALAHGEAALRREVGKPNALTWQAPDVLSVPTVFDVVTSEMSQTFDDLDELRRSRTFVVTLTCAPFARSADLATVAGLEVGGTASTVSVDTCDSTTGWEAFINGSSAGPPDPAWSGTSGGLWVYELYDPYPQTLALTRTGTFSVASTPYIVVIAQVQVDSAVTSARAVVDGVTQDLVLLSQRKIPTSGQYEYVFQVSGSTVTSLTLSNYTEITTPAAFGVFDVSRTNLPPGQTPRQPSRIVEVRGTERTPGSLRISSPDGTSPLRLVLAATWPENGSGFSPPLRRWRSNGNTETVTADTYSGKTEPLDPSYVQFDVPIESLPVGTYQLMMLAKADAGGDYAVESTIQSRHNGVTLGETTWGAGGTEVVTIPAGWFLVPMGVYGIPIAAAKAGEFRISIKAPGAPGVTFDEAWLFPVGDNCALTIAVATEPHLWLDSADADSRVPRIWEGASVDKTDAHYPANGIYTMGKHVFIPERTAVFTAAGVDWPDVTLTYHKRWHSNAAED